MRKKSRLTVKSTNVTEVTMTAADLRLTIQDLEDFTHAALRNGFLEADTVNVSTSFSHMGDQLRITRYVDADAS